MYGPFMEMGKYSLVISKFIEAVQAGNPLLLDATGSQTRDFIHVSDAISALSLIIQHGKSGDIYNIGSGESVSIRELADIVSSKQVHTPPRIGHIEHTLADTSKLKELGWKPEIDVKTWLTNLVADLSITSNIKQEEK
jgi:UDP-glucose 4-epimerase